MLIYRYTDVLICFYCYEFYDEPAMVSVACARVVLMSG